MPVGQLRKPQKEYTFEEDTQIVAQAVVNIVLSTREEVDPVPFVAALLEGYARRVQTKDTASLTQPVFTKPQRRRAKSELEEQ